MTSTFDPFTRKYDVTREVSITFRSEIMSPKAGRTDGRTDGGCIAMRP